MAERFLVAKGWRLLQRNFTIPGGEIDLIFKIENEKTIVFVEVKTRRSKVFGEIESQISRKKQECLIRAGQTWLERNNLENANWRIDLVAVFAPENFSAREIKHWENAVNFL